MSRMSYEEFAKRFEVLRKFREDTARRNGLLRQLFPETRPFDEHGEELFEAYVGMLSLMMGDKEEWIEYYIWETNMGNLDREITLKDTSVLLKTTEDLYRIMTT